MPCRLMNSSLLLDPGVKVVPSFEKSIIFKQSTMISIPEDMNLKILKYLSAVVFPSMHILMLSRII